MYEILEQSPVISAVRTDEDLFKALTCPSKIVFLLSSDILSLQSKIEKTHNAGKLIFIHTDFCNGLGKDNFALKFIKNLNADGIITTKSNVVFSAKELGLKTVQRFFIIDSLSVSTALDNIRHTKPDLIEIMPGVLPFAVKKFVHVKIPVIAGGLIQSKHHIIDALDAGAAAVSTANHELWYM